MTNKIPYIEAIDRIVKAGKAGSLIIFAGAGISVLPPTCAPTWNKLKIICLTSMLQKLIDKNWPITPYLLSIKDKILDLNMRPETFFYYLSLYLGTEFSRHIIAPINNSMPNKNHYLIAYLFKERFIRSLVTTNFDTYIEKAIEAIDKNEKIKFLEKVLICENDFSVSNGLKDHYIFKPHGCISSHSSMAFEIGQIRQLHPWKVNVFKKLVTNCHILFLGYSGYDEDIMPVLSEILNNSKKSFSICKHPTASTTEPILQIFQNNTNACIIEKEADILLENILTAIEQSAPKYTIKEAENCASTSWELSIPAKLQEVQYDLLAIIISHLLFHAGHSQDSYLMANFAEDIVLDSGLTDDLKSSLAKIRFLQQLSTKTQRDISSSRFYSHLSIEEQGVLLNPDTSLELGMAHLIDGNLKAADLYINGAGGMLNIVGNFSGNKTNSLNDVTQAKYYFYKAILIRKEYLLTECEKDHKLLDANQLFLDAAGIFKKLSDFGSLSRVLLDYGLLLCLLQDFEKAQYIWQQSVNEAEFVNDWVIAAKAAFNRGVLLRVSDKPDLGVHSLEQAKEFYKKAASQEGVKKTQLFLDMDREDIVPYALGLGRS